MSDGLRVAELDFDGLIAREWLSTNGLGGYASSTVAGMNTRRYHGLLVAAMSPPVRRMVLLSRVEETLVCGGRECCLSTNEYPGTVWPRGYEYLRAFSTDPFPRWAYQGDGWTLEKQVRLLRGENTVLLSYTLLGTTSAVELELRPLLALRAIHDLGFQWNGRLQADARGAGHWRIPATNRSPEVFFAHDGIFDRKPNWYLNTIYRREAERGYPGLEDVWCPGVARVRMMPGQPVYFACSVDPIELSSVVNKAGRQLRAAPPLTAPALAGDRPASTTSATADVPEHAAMAADDDLHALVRASEAFVLRAGAAAAESPACTVQYHWNAPSPRAALAGFAGLYLAPGRFNEAQSLLQSMLPRLQNGLLPSELPEDASAPIYHGADVSLWFVNAVRQYLLYSGDEATVRRHLFEPVLEILTRYRHGTSVGALEVRTDAEGLIVARASGAGTTWMDAKAGNWLMTPRHGRAVEVNALWYNALRIGADLAQRFDRPDAADALNSFAVTVASAFNQRFWNPSANCCFDVVDESGNDRAIRPNQLLAISLPYPVLSAERHATVVDVVGADLLTPVGVRTLLPGDRHYHGRYAGNALERDCAYHNGTVFPWLLGPFVTAFVRTRGGTDAARAEARRLLEPILRRLRTDGLGQLCELFDGDPPHHPGGAIASPLAVGEILRCYAEDILGRTTGAPRRSQASIQEPNPVASTNLTHDA